MKVKYNFLDNQMNFTAELNKDTKLSKNFKLWELANNKGDKDLPMFEFNIYSILLVKMLQEFRDFVSLPVNVNSCYRQVEYNKKVGGDKNSAHLKAWAADIQKINGFYDNDIIIIWQDICVKNCQIGAIGLYDTFYHLEINSDKLFGSKKFMIRDNRS